MFQSAIVLVKTKKHILERLKTIKTIIELMNPWGCDPPPKDLDGWKILEWIEREEIVPFLDPFLAFLPM